VVGCVARGDPDLQEDNPVSAEFARTYEQYVIEGGGEKVLCPRAGPQGVIPYRGSLEPEWLKREPHDDVDAHFQKHDRFLVLHCVCKKEKVHAHGKRRALPTSAAASPCPRGPSRRRSARATSSGSSWA
jgi:hypothetical protein